MQNLAEIKGMDPKDVKGMKADVANTTLEKAF